MLPVALATLAIALPCELTVYHPTGRLLFQKSLQGPREMPCSILDAAVDASGNIAASISYGIAVGYASGIIMMDPAGQQTGFIDTGRYVPAHIGFDKHQTLWSIGWQRDEIRNEIADREDYFLVRRYSKAGAQDGAFIPRSTWKTTGDPAGGSIGFWHMAFASDRIGAIVYKSWQRVPEWIEWDLYGNLLSRTPMDSADYSGGRAYTSSAQLFGLS